MSLTTILNFENPHMPHNLWSQIPIIEGDQAPFPALTIRTSLPTPHANSEISGNICSIIFHPDHQGVLLEFIPWKNEIGGTSTIAMRISYMVETTTEGMNGYFTDLKPVYESTARNRSFAHQLEDTIKVFLREYGSMVRSMEDSLNDAYYLETERRFISTRAMLAAVSDNTSGLIETVTSRRVW